MKPQLTLLLPELRRVATQAPLPLWLTRGDHRPDAKPGRAVALRECFEFVGASPPAAALTRSLDADDAAGAVWLRADPAYVMADAATARLMACGNLGLSQDESAELARALRPLFGDAGFPLEPARSDRWYLRCPAGARLPTFVDPEQMLGGDLMQFLPRGDNERQWRHLLNEVQVILHNHPINVRRAQRGQVPANSLWFWGTGSLPDWVRSRFTQIASADAIVVALARLAKIPVVEQDGALLGEDASILVDAVDLPSIEAQQFANIDLLFASGERFAYKPWHRWRIWRRVRI
ncbi:MAG: phosphoglycerate mutase [Rudaea sp.]